MMGKSTKNSAQIFIVLLVMLFLFTNSVDKTNDMEVLSQEGRRCRFQSLADRSARDGFG